MNETELGKVINSANTDVVISSEQLTISAWKFLLRGKSRRWLVKLEFPETFPFCLPVAKLLDTELIRRLPHVNQRGIICLEESDSILCNYYIPGQVIGTFLWEVVKLLDRVSLDIYQDELLDELEGYYNSAHSVNSFYEPSDYVEFVSLKITRYKKQNSPKHLLPITILDTGTSQTFSDTSELKQFQTINILHLPLQYAVLPPKAAADIDSKYLERLVEHLNDSNSQQLVKLLNKTKPSAVFFILLTMPRKGGERTQLLLKLVSKKSAFHPLVEQGNHWDVTLFGVRRSTKRFLVKRGGADDVLINRSVAIIGCGSVGSLLANTLAKAGVGRLILIDPDFLLPENIHRHLLGGNSLTYLPSDNSKGMAYWPKTLAIARHLTKELPNISVKPLFESFSESLARKHLPKCDIIISAVGGPSINLLINTTLKSLGYRHVIYCWNEAAGCGGHSVAHDLSETCLECLHRDKDGNFVPNQLSLIQPGQPISRNLTGCGGTFTPFSYLDSMKTAQMATSQAINLLQGKSANFAESWKGEASQPLLMTTRYEKMAMMEQVNINQNVYCGVCGE